MHRHDLVNMAAAALILFLSAMAAGGLWLTRYVGRRHVLTIQYVPKKLGATSN
jgi:hypothetical protein